MAAAAAVNMLFGLSILLLPGCLGGATPANDDVDDMNDADAALFVFADSADENDVFDDEQLDEIESSLFMDEFIRSLAPVSNVLPDWAFDDIDDVPGPIFTRLHTRFTKQSSARHIVIMLLVSGIRREAACDR